MSSAKRIIKSMTALFFGMGFLFAGNALIISSIGVILKHNGASSFAVGVVSACFFIGALCVGRFFRKKLFHA